MKTYHFKVILAGSGNNIDEAWQDAIEGFSLEPGCPPEDEFIEEVENEN